MDKQQKLNQMAINYDPSSPMENFDYWFIRLGWESISKHIKGNSALELGCSTGLTTELLSDKVANLYVVEGAKDNIEKTKTKLVNKKNIHYFHSLWEKFSLPQKVDNIILTRGLEHIEEPVDFLKQIGQWLTPKGRLHITVPNANSLHRHIGVYLGLIPDIYHLHEADIKAGHYRVYDRELLCKQLQAAHFSPQYWEGIMLKPLSNQQMLNWSEELIKAFFKAGNLMPDYCGEIYVWSVLT